MDMTNWAPEHSDVLRELVVRGVAFAEIADTINARFKTNYTRSAAIGRARRLGIAGPSRPPGLPSESALDELFKRHPFERQSSRYRKAKPAPESAELRELRRADVEPRDLSLVELEVGDCRYPYGGDAEGEPITFCGHPRRPGSSYCGPHFRLSRSPELLSADPARLARLLPGEAS
jgi:GcrA cell cycle regulator